MKLSLNNDQSEIEKHEKYHKLLDAVLDEKISKYDKKSKSDEFPPYYECAITFELMKNPYATTAGNSYEKNYIEECLGRDSRDPITREFASHNHLYENKTLRKAIECYKAENDL